MHNVETVVISVARMKLMKITELANIYLHHYPFVSCKLHMNISRNCFSATGANRLMLFGEKEEIYSDNLTRQFFLMLKNVVHYALKVPRYCWF
jgi:hypothetical protein